MKCLQNLKKSRESRFNNRLKIEQMDRERQIKRTTRKCFDEQIDNFDQQLVQTTNTYEL